MGPRLRTIIVDVADLKVSDDAGAEIVTYALGSCLGVTVYDPKRRVGGMLHFQLPLSSKLPQRATENPAMFGDLGIPLLFSKMYEKGCVKSDIIVTVAGGASVTDATDFDIGKRNYTTLRKLFWKNGVVISGEDVGGSVPRTMRLEVGTGKVELRIQQEARVLWSPPPSVL